MITIAIILRPIVRRVFVLLGLRMILKHKGEVDADADFNKGQLHIKKKK